MADRFAAGLIWLAVLLITMLFVWLLSDLVIGGVPHISWEFLTAIPRDAGRAGGIGPIIVSTMLLLLVTLSVSVPIGLGTAMLLAEFTSAHSVFGRSVRRSLDVLAGVPSIVFGLFGNAFFCITLGMGFSILSGGLTLACMVLPLLIRAAEEGFRSVPQEYRLASAALGMSQTTSLFRVILPAAVPGILVGIVLGVGRALAETAALIFTSGYVDRLPGSLFDSGRSLSIHVYDLSMNVAGGNAQARASAFVLVLLLLAINVAAGMVMTRWLGRRVVTV